MSSRTVSRRSFLKGAGLAATTVAAGGGSVLVPAFAADAPGWQNWSGNQQANPAAVLYPRDEADLVQAVKSARGPIRAFGGSHSFSALVPTDGTLLSLEQMTGLIDHDPATHRATLGGGTRIAIASELLNSIGQHFENEPDINLQSVAGAISTSTHGTGMTLRAMSGYVTQLKLVLADGSVVTCSAERDRELFDAARVSMGCLGIISEATFQNRAAYRLAEDTKVMDLADAMAFIDRQRNIDRHVEIFVFPFGGKAMVQQMNITADAETPAVDSTFDENELVRLASEAVRLAPVTKGMIQKLVGAFVEETRRVAPAHRMFPNVRTVQFNEMEYTVPAEQGLACLQEVVDVIRARDFPVFFPIEYRYTAADDTAVGMFAGQAGASISVHQYHKQDYRELFNAIEPVFRKYRGRPHWGKLHTMGAKDLRAVYPRLDEFLAVRRRVDPEGRFLNPYLRHMLGVSV